MGGGSARRGRGRASARGRASTCSSEGGGRGRRGRRGEAEDKPLDMFVMPGTEFPGNQQQHAKAFADWTAARLKMRVTKKSIWDRKSKMGTASELRHFDEARHDMQRAAAQVRGVRYERIGNLQAEVATDMDDAEREMQKSINQQTQALNKLRKAKGGQAMLAAETADVVFDAFGMESSINGGDRGDCCDDSCVSDSRCGSGDEQ